MKIPASAMKSMMDMVIASLPYEDRIHPKSKEAILTQNIIDELSKCGPEFQSMTGFFNMIIKKMDSCPIQQKAAKELFIKVNRLIEGSGVLSHEGIVRD